MLSVRQRWTILIVGILVAVGVYALSNWAARKQFSSAVQFAGARRCGAVIVQKLKESSTPFRLSNNGTTVSVPEERVAELRLEMAGAGVPKSGRIGFEIFDKTNFGMTDFAEHVNYRRALEGELERSVMTVGEIEQARVHISLPQESVFFEARQPAKASVLVKIRPGHERCRKARFLRSRTWSRAPSKAWRRKCVSVLDMRGNLLNRPKRHPGSQSATQAEASEAALEYRQHSGTGS